MKREPLGNPRRRSPTLLALFILTFLFLLNAVFYRYFLCKMFHLFTINHTQIMNCPVGWGCINNRLHFCRGVSHHPTSILDMTLNNLVPVMLELWGMRRTLSLRLLPGPFWPLSGSTWKGPINGLNSIKLCTYAKLKYLN